MCTPLVANIYVKRTSFKKGFWQKFLISKMNVDQIKNLSDGLMRIFGLMKAAD
jgi:hypothetical protein